MDRQRRTAYMPTLCGAPARLLVRGHRCLKFFRGPCYSPSPRRRTTPPSIPMLSSPSPPPHLWTPRPSTRTQLSRCAGQGLPGPSSAPMFKVFFSGVVPFCALRRASAAPCPRPSSTRALGPRPPSRPLLARPSPSRCAVALLFCSATASPWTRPSTCTPRGMCGVRGRLPMLEPAPMRARLPALRPSPRWSLGIAAALRRSLLPRPPPRLLSPSPSRWRTPRPSPLPPQHPHPSPHPYPRHRYTRGRRPRRRPTLPGTLMTSWTPPSPLLSPPPLLRAMRPRTRTLTCR